MRLIVIRHAETDGNKQRFVGREDIALNAAGRQQVARLAAALSAQTIDAVFSSPLSRAVATAQPLATARGLEVQLRSALIEIDYGNLQGTIKGARPFRLRKEYLDKPMPDGESLRDVWQRLGTMASELNLALRAGSAPAVVGHYWSNRLLVAMLAGKTLGNALATGTYKPANASSYALDFRDAGDTLLL
jgi:probable phosphoglycerate mutase